MKSLWFTAPRDQDYLKLFFDREKGINNRIDLDEDALSSLCQILDGLIGTADPLERQILTLQFFKLLRSGSGVSAEGHTDQLTADVEAALRYMDDHLTEEMDIKALARGCSVSVNTLERHFKEQLNTTPFVMLRRKRLFASIMYLKSGNSVAEAAQKCGFADYSNYIQLFKKQFGITPGQYKRRM